MKSQNQNRIRFTENKAFTWRIVSGVDIPGRGYEVGIQACATCNVEFLLIPSDFARLLDLTNANLITISTTNDEKPVDPTADL